MGKSMMQHFLLLVSNLRLSHWKDETDEGWLKPFYCHNTLPATAYQLFLQLIFMHLVTHRQPCMFVYLQSFGTKLTLHPLTTLQNNEPVPPWLIIMNTSALCINRLGAEVDSGQWTGESAVTKTKAQEVCVPAKVTHLCPSMASIKKSKILDR